MEKDELLKRVLMMQRLQGMETEPVSAEDPYASMEKDQLISMIHFLVKREDEPTNEASVESNSFGLYLVRRRKNKNSTGTGEPGTEGYGERTEGYP